MKKILCVVIAAGLVLSIGIQLHQLTVATELLTNLYVIAELEREIETLQGVVAKEDYVQKSRGRTWEDLSKEDRDAIEALGLQEKK